MKKFLTVLLALSVVFTYTVGTAFAAVTPAEAVAAKVNTEQTAMAKAVHDYADTIVYNQKGFLVSAPDGQGADLANPDTNLTKAAIDYTVEKIISDYNEKIQTAGADALKGVYDQAAADAAIEAAWDGVDTAAKIQTALFTTYAADDGVLYTKAVADAKAAALAVIDAVVLSAYDETAAATIKAELDKQREAINVAANSKVGLGAVKTAREAVETELEKHQTTAAQEKELADHKTAAKQAIGVKADTFKGTETTRLQTIIDTAASTPAAVAAATTSLNNLAANIAQVLAFYEAQIDAVAITKTVDLTAAKAAVTAVKDKALLAFATPQFDTEVNNLAGTELLIKYATDYAAQMKNMYDKATGLAVYNVSTVDKGLAAVTIEIKKQTQAMDTYGEVKAWMDDTTKIPTADMEKASLSTVIADGIMIITEDNPTTKANNTELDALIGTYASTLWDGESKTAVEAIQKDYTKKINAATTADEVIALVKEAQKAMGKYLTITQVTNVKDAVLLQLKALGYVGNDATVDDAVNNNAVGSMSTYADGIAAKDSKNTYTAGIKGDAVNQAAKVLYDAVLAEQNAALTAVQIKVILQNNYAAALTMIDAMKPEETLKAAAADLVNAIKALPTTATLEGKEQYLAVQQSLDAYLKNPGTLPGDIYNAGLLTAYMSRIVYLEKNAVESLVRALPRTITIADKEAVEAARAAVDAYDKAYGEYDTAPYVYGYGTVSNLKTLTDAETAISNAMIVDAAKKIAALPNVIKAEDKEAVEAARAAYDALSDADKDVFNKALYDKLVDAEKQLATTDEAYNKYLKLGVQTTTIKIYSKAYKGYTKISWKKSLGFKVDGYEVYRATKKNGKYTKIWTAKSTGKSVKNTKNLISGKKYYYYVKGFRMIDGEKVYTKKSITIYRTAK